MVRGLATPLLYILALTSSIALYHTAAEVRLASGNERGCSYLAVSAGKTECPAGWLPCHGIPPLLFPSAGRPSA